MRGPRGYRLPLTVWPDGTLAGATENRRPARFNHPGGEFLLGWLACSGALAASFIVRLAGKLFYASSVSRPVAVPA